MKEKKKDTKETGKDEQDVRERWWCTRRVESLVTRNVMALPTARGALRGLSPVVFSAKLVMRTLYDTASRY